ncbi:MAG: OB-fold nucleic acid binding domain-containing protein, partial [Anaerolineae bacterium]
MSLTLEKLKKILNLERDQGYRDRAVIGGLKRFVARWQEEALDAISDARAKRQIRIITELLRGYEHKDVESRESTVREALKQLHNVTVLEQTSKEQTHRSDGGRSGAHTPETGSDDQPQAGAAQAQRSIAPPEQIHEKVEQAALRQAQDAGQTRSSQARIDLDLQTPVDEIHGISDTYRRRLNRLGVRTVEDLLYLFPRRYDDFSALKTINQLEYGEEVTIVGTVWESRNRRTRSGQTITTTIFSDATGTIQATWFNQPYLTRQLRPGRKIVLGGRVEKYLGRLTFQSPEWEP